MWAIYVGRCLSRTLKKSPCPGRGSNRGSFDLILALYHVATVVSYWRKYVHEVLVNRLGGLSLPRKSVVRLTDRPDMTLDVYCGRKTTIQYNTIYHVAIKAGLYRKAVQVYDIPTLYPVPIILW